MTRSYKLLGSLEIEENGRLAPLMKSRKGCALLTYLIVTGQAQPRIHIADLLWEASSTSNALGNLRRLLGVIRKQAPELLITHQTLSFQPQPTTHVDYQQLQLVLEQVEMLEGDMTIRQLDEGLKLYRGDLLTTFYLDGAPYFNEWLTLTRERLRQEVFAAYHRLCVANHEAETWEMGIAIARRWLALDDLHEETHRWLIRFLVAAGQLAAAQVQYEACRARLWEELGVEPEAETQQLAVQLVTQAKAQSAPTDVLPIRSLQPSAETPWQPDPLPDPATPAPLGDLPPRSVLPYRRNPDFTGRENELVALGQQLLPWEGNLPQPPSTSSGQALPRLGEQASPPSGGLEGGRSIAITGMGGLGKTQLAVEFAYRYGRFFKGGVYWLSFAQAESVAEEIAAIGGERGMRLFKEADKISLTDQIGRVQRAWQETTPRLLIFDNCEDEQLLQQWIPVSGGCRVLLTSRRGDWARELSVLSRPLVTLTRDESIRLIYRLAPHIAANAAPAVGQIADYLGDLPLALHLAGSFLHRYQRITPAIYLQQLDKVGLLQHPSLQGRATTLSPTHHELNVARTFAINFEQLETTDEVDAIALRLLAAIACFAPGEPIPTRLLLATVQRGDDDFMAELLAEDGLARIISLGFVRTAENETVVMHRLLVQFTQTQLPDNDEIRTAVAQTVVDAFRTLTKKAGAYFTLPLASVHVHQLIQTSLGSNKLLAIHLTSYLGQYFSTLADYVSAQKYLEQGLAMSQALYGHHHNQTANSMSVLGGLHMGAGNYKEAKKVLQEALAISEQVSDPNEDLIGAIANNLGYVLSLQGGYEQARPYLEKALTLNTQADPPIWPRIANHFNNLGVIFLNLGEDEAAQEHLAEGLRLRETHLRAEHPFIAVSLQNLGLLSIKQGNFAQAQAYLDKAFALRQKTVGDQHPHTARSLNALGELALVQAAYEKAQAYLEQALAIQETIFSVKHPEKALTLKNLAEVYWAKGEREQARPFYEQALAILEETAVPEHPDFSLLHERLTALDSN